MDILINYTNHPSNKWSEEQKQGWDIIIDISFPNIPSDYSGCDFYLLLINETHKIETVIGEFYEKNQLAPPRDINICIMGEQSYVSYFIKNVGKHSVYDCYFWFPITEEISEDKVNEDGSVSKVSKFVKWRKIS